MHYNHILAKAEFLYGNEEGRRFADKLRAMLEKFPAPLPDGGSGGMTEKDAVFITYPDQFTGVHAAPLGCLYEFATRFLSGVVPAMHILPFCPYTSDDGFSVSDYRQVKPEHGTWDDIGRLASGWRIMYDFVCNHVSVSHPWFQGYLRGDLRYRNYFIEADPEDSRLAQVTRPRSLPLLHEFDTAHGKKYLWTTFSRDQVDLNYACPDLLLDIIDTLLFYIARGAKLIRLDAVGFIWKKLGTSCMHLPETHAVVKLMRLVLDAVAPDVVLVTETNVPHEFNISYLGNGHDEAGMVYQFPLPPLVLHSFFSGDARKLSGWAGSIQPPSDSATYFNFLASHDGVGVMPLRGILTSEEVQSVLDAAVARGGRISYKTETDGSSCPYEINISYLSALSPASDDIPTAARKMAAAYAIAMVMPGVPGIYAHSLIGSRNWEEGVQALGYNRAINRERLDVDRVAGELQDSATLRHAVYQALNRLLRIRAGQPCFHPNAGFQVLDVDRRVFCVRRTKGDESVLSCINVSGEPVSLALDGGCTQIDSLYGPVARMDDKGVLRVEIEPYGVAWMRCIR